MILRACSADSFAILSLNRYIHANGAMKYLTDWRFSKIPSGETNFLPNLGCRVSLNKRVPNTFPVVQIVAVI